MADAPQAGADGEQSNQYVKEVEKRYSLEKQRTRLLFCSSR